MRLRVSAIRRFAGQRASCSFRQRSNLPRIAVLTRIIDALAFLPGLEAANWQEILPEYDPYKYNSFAVNSTRQVLAATNTLARAVDQAQSAGLLDSLPPVIAWQSVIDSTVGARGVFDSVFGRLTGEQHELVLFDVNRLAVFRSLETARVAGLPQLLSDLQRPHTLTVVANRNDASELVVMRLRKPGQAWTEIETGLCLASQHRIGRPRRALLSARRSGLRVHPRQRGERPAGAGIAVPARRGGSALSAAVGVYSPSLQSVLRAYRPSGRRDVGCGFTEVSRGTALPDVNRELYLLVNSASNLQQPSSTTRLAADHKLKSSY